MQTIVRSRVYPTENQERVEKAITNIFADLSYIVVENETHFEVRSPLNRVGSLDWLRQRIHELKIIGVVRSRLLSNWNGRSTWLCLDKQAAFSGRVRVADDSEESSPLGFIEIAFEFDTDPEFQRFLSWFAPRTVDGHVVEG